MRHIGSIVDEAEAERFGDYLLTLGIKNSVEEGASGWAVWVENDDDVERAKGELAAYQANPSDARFAGVSRKAEAIRAGEEKRQRRLRKKFIDVRTQGAGGRDWNVPLTIFMVAACLAVGLATRLGKQLEPVGDALLINSVSQEYYRGYIQRQMQAGLKDPRVLARLEERADPGLDQIRHGQVWRLVTPIFLHYGAIHLLFNMFWLVDLGSQIEARKKTLFFGALVLVSAVISNLVQFWWTGRSGAAGMSGVVYALFGYAWMKGRYDPSSGMGMNQNSVWTMLTWLVVCMTGMLGPIANAAHVAGLVIGVAIGAAPHWRMVVRRGLK